VTGSSPADLFGRLLLSIAQDANSTDGICQALDLLGGRLDPRARRALRVAVLEIGGQERDAGGRPEIDDRQSLLRVVEAIARGRPRSAAVHDEARRMASDGGGAVETHAHRLRDKLRKIYGENPLVVSAER
jgi:hypothetical protein